MSDPTFYRTRFEVEVLSDFDVSQLNLDDIYYQITDGDCSGQVSLVSVEILSLVEVSDALVAQGSDPEFLLGDPDL